MLTPIQSAKAQEYFEYNIQIREDASAYWKIQQFSASDATVESWTVFQQKIFNIVESAQILTNRDMDIDETSIQINTTISAESKITEYSFLWQNFSVINGNELSFGDVFQVNDFFGHLFGDAALQLSYPTDYSVQSVYPAPFNRQDTDSTMKWARTQDLAGDNTTIVLTLKPDSSNSSSRQTGFMVLILIVVGACAAVLVFYIVKKRRIKNKPSQTPPATSVGIETEEDKILKLLKTQGGALRQSEITEQLRFSKAKTSQLLTQLETAGKLTRYKKGRDKIVTFKERVKEK